MARERRDLTGFGDWLRERREAKGWIQDAAVEELLRVAGRRTTRHWLSQIENGERPSEALARDWERVFGDFQPRERRDDDLASAIYDLADAVRAQTKAQDDWLRGTVRGLLAQLGLPAEQLVPDAPSTPEPLGRGR